MAFVFRGGLDPFSCSIKHSFHFIHPKCAWELNPGDLACGWTATCVPSSSARPISQPSPEGVLRVSGTGAVYLGGGGAQWVRFASPQAAPTAPATTVFIALYSVFQILFLLSDCAMAGVRGKYCSSLIVHCTRSAARGLLPANV